MKKAKKKVTPFSELSPSQQRIKVAKDVLLQLKKKKYVATVGKYIDSYDFSKMGLKYDDDIKKNFKKIKECKCCALGSCLLSITKFKNTLTIKDVSSKENFQNSSGKLLKMFTPKQLLLIENSFEGKPSGDYTSRIGKNVFGEDTTLEEDEKCRSFYWQYSDTNSRLIAIMQNIIKNKGTFVL